MNYGERHAILISEHKGNILSQNVAFTFSLYMITTCLNHRSLHLKLLSVVIPAYNVEKYINQCLHSFVVKRILPFIEVLIINDGSNDATYDMAAAYERQYPDTFKVITKQNGGHGSAINMGIKEATGKYFKVVDGDDWVDPQALTALIETLRISNSDVVFHNFYWVENIFGIYIKAFFI